MRNNDQCYATNNSCEMHEANIYRIKARKKNDKYTVLQKLSNFWFYFWAIDAHNDLPKTLNLSEVRSGKVTAEKSPVRKRRTHRAWVNSIHLSWGRSSAWPTGTPVRSGRVIRGTEGRSLLQDCHSSTCSGQSGRLSGLFFLENLIKHSHCLRLSRGERWLRWRSQPPFAYNKSFPGLLNKYFLYNVLSTLFMVSQAQ